MPYFFSEFLDKKKFAQTIEKRNFEASSSFCVYLFGLEALAGFCARVFFCCLLELCITKREGRFSGFHEAKSRKTAFSLYVFGRVV